MEQEILLSPIRISEISELVEKAVRKAIQESLPLLVEKNSDQDGLLSIAEACTLLKLAKPTIYYLAAHSRIPFMKKGKKLYFLKKELIEWVRSGRKIDQIKPSVLKMKRSKKSNT